MPRLHSEIKLVNLSFNDRRGAAVPHDFNLTFQAGENVALVGHTGAGKSSITKLIARFTDSKRTSANGARGLTVNWRFTTQDVRVKLKRLYPII